MKLAVIRFDPSGIEREEEINMAGFHHLKLETDLGDRFYLENDRAGGFRIGIYNEAAIQVIPNPSASWEIRIRRPATIREGER